MLIYCSTNDAGSFVSIFIWSKFGEVFRVLRMTLKAIYVTG